MMPVAAMCKFPKMKDESEFEDFVADLLSRRARADLKRLGRRGQAQQGVDLFGPLHADASKLMGVPCKNVETLTLKQIETEGGLADGFRPALAVFSLATSLDRDQLLQRKVEALSQARLAQQKFPVEICFWQTLESELGGHRDLISKYYPDFVGPRAPPSHEAEVRSRALALVRGATIAGKASTSTAAFITSECRLEDDLDVEAAYSLMGDPRVVDANVDEVRGVVMITVNRSSFPTALLLSFTEDESQPY